MAVSAKQKKHFKQLAHHLDPVVTISENGLTEGVVEELKRALYDHELIKVKLAIYEREDREEALNLALNASGSELIQKIGKVAIIYKPTDKPNPKTSNILRGIQP